MTHPTPPPEVFIVGGGPAGLAAAIAASRQGLRVAVADSLRPPIDKACGEGLMPDAVAALHDLGVRFSSGEAIPFHGIRFLDGRSGLSVEARFPQGPGLAVRRTTLHARLAQRAAEAGAAMRWGASVTLLENGKAVCDGREIDSDWIVGADGLQSHVRQWAGLQPARSPRKRFGFRLHFRMTSWTDLVEVYWGPDCQIAVTPTAQDEVGLALVSRNPGLRIRDALHRMPVLAARLAGAEPIARERGAPSIPRKLPALFRGRVALIGDASSSVDPVTGEGLGLSFRQAIALAEALRAGHLRGYQAAHRRIGRMPHRMSRLILLMDRSAWLRERALRAMSAEPQLFARLLSANGSGPASSSLGAADALRLGWRMARS